MAQTRVNKPRSVSMVRKSANANAKGNAKANGNLSSPQAIFELKQRVILVLNKLADRDTYQIAVEELQRIAETLSPEGFGPFLSCIFETDSQQKSTVRRECVKVFATLAGFHGELLAPHLPKMVGSIIRRLKDPDSNVRDACVDAIGVLASKIMHPSGNSGVENGGPFSVFVKPLFEALGEQNRQLQAGSALCLARVIDNAEDPPVSTLQRILPRIMKLLSNQSFSANAALLSVIGSIVQAGGASTQQTLSVLVPCMLGTLQSSDWTTRKAAAEAFARMALGLGPLLTSFKSSCLTALESCRFDKTLQAWKSIPDSKSSSPLTEKGASLKENVCEGGVSVDCKSTIPTVRKSTFLRKSVTSVAKSASDSNSFGTIKKRTPLTDKKTNPSLSRKLDRRKTDNWHIEVAVPWTCPAPIPVLCDEEFNNSYNTRTCPAPIPVICDEEFNSSYSAEVSERSADIKSRHGCAETTGKTESSRQSAEIRSSLTTGKTESSRQSDEIRSSFETKCILVDKPFEGNSSTDTTPCRKCHC